MSEEYKHNEAFCLMEYTDEATGETEILWNSRDGVTPFIIRSRAGNEAVHTNWKRDRREPNYAPPIGSRVFVDASPNHAHIRSGARSYVNDIWKHGAQHSLHKASGAEMTKGEAVDFFIAEWTGGGKPTIIDAERYLRGKRDEIRIN